jgi:hypothetical protein
MIATVIYTVALFTTIKQNSIILSQSIKPYYQNEIEKFNKRSKKIRLEDDSLFLGEKINPKNYIVHISKVLANIASNEEFQRDFDLHSNGIKLTNEEIKTRSYFREVIFLSSFTMQLNDISFFHNELMSLIQEINLSKLIDEDKMLLKKQIQRIFFRDYIMFIEFEDKNSFIPQLPILYRRPRESDLYFEKLSQTNFRSLYTELQKEALIKL